MGRKEVENDEQKLEIANTKKQLEILKAEHERTITNMKIEFEREKLESNESNSNIYSRIQDSMSIIQHKSLMRIGSSPQAVLYQNKYIKLKKESLQLQRNINQLFNAKKKLEEENEVLRAEVVNQKHKNEILKKICSNGTSNKRLSLTTAGSENYLNGKRKENINGDDDPFEMDLNQCSEILGIVCDF